MAKRKEGIITHEEAITDREKAKILSENSRCMFSNMVPHRIDSKTIALFHPGKDLEEQINIYSRKLEKSRMNY